MTGAEHAAKAEEYGAFVETAPGTTPEGAVGLALSLGAALVHAVLANAYACTEDRWQ